jgi:hypothetical protein
MLTEHQRYSPEKQIEIIRRYAATHNMEIGQELLDHSRSQAKSESSARSMFSVGL